MKPPRFATFQKVVLALVTFSALVIHEAVAENVTNSFELREGGIIRGSKARKEIALEFTGDSFAEGGATILNALKQHNAKASFFFTGTFLRNPDFKPLIERIIADGHYIGPHSDAHLLYCPWSGKKTTLVSRDVFRSDLEQNLKAIEAFGIKRARVTHWIPPYEWYNEEIVAWSKELGLTLVNFTLGTRSNADYTEDAAKNFIPSKVIIESIVKKEREDPNGLNGFLLLLHVGVGPKRTDKMHERLDGLLTVLKQKGYQFVTVPDLLSQP